MSKSEEYRANAADCIRLARIIDDQQTRLGLIDMAQTWLRLAEQAQLSQSTAGAEDPTKRIRPVDPTK